MKPCPIRVNIINITIEFQLYELLDNTGASFVKRVNKIGTIV